MRSVNGDLESRSRSESVYCLVRFKYSGLRHMEDELVSKSSCFFLVEIFKCTATLMHYQFLFMHWAKSRYLLLMTLPCCLINEDARKASSQGIITFDSQVNLQNASGVLLKCVLIKSQERRTLTCHDRLLYWAKHLQ